MDDIQSNSLENRIERLEKAIVRLERLTARLLRSEERPEIGREIHAPIPESIEPQPAGDALFPTSVPSAVAPANQTTDRGRESHLPTQESAESENVRNEQLESRHRISGEKIAAFEKRRAESWKSENWLDGFLNTENWLGRVGIGLLLFGLAFLFKYSVDQGWLTPTVRLLIGVALGVGLIFFSSRTYRERRYLSLLLFGGGVASFLVTGFAAFQVFSLVSHPVAYASLVAVTVITFLVSLKQNEAILALVGLIGGFATPFLLYTDDGTLAGLLTYLSLLVGCASAIYFFKGWRSLLWLTVLGAWCVLGFGLIVSSPFSAEAAAGDRMPMQLGILFTWLVFALVPFGREIISDRDGSRHPSWLEGDHLLGLSARQSLFRRQHVFVLVTVTPLLALMYSSPVWSLSDLTAGLLIMGGAALYWGAALAQYRSRAMKNFFPFHALAGIILFTISLAVLLDERSLLLALTAEAVVLHELGLRYFWSETRMLAHIVFVMILVGLIERLLNPIEGTLAFLNPDGLTDMAVLAAGAFVSYRSPSRIQSPTYAGVVHLCFLALVYRELIFLDNGQGIVTIVWGTYAVILFVSGLLSKKILLRIMGSATLIVVVAKLFLVDLAALETIWRVLLFMGFGGLFLVLSYYFKALTEDEMEED